MTVLRDLTIAALLALPLMLLTGGPAHAEDPCPGYDEATDFCGGGPSMVECPGGYEVPQGDPCGTNPCEEDGTCDHMDPPPPWAVDEPATCEPDERSARGYCPDDADGHAAERDALFDLEVPGPTTHAPEPELPHTGAGDTVPVAVAGAAALAAGVAILRRTA